MNAHTLGQIAAVVASIVLGLIIFLLESAAGRPLTFRIVNERPGEWHVGVWFDRDNFSLRFFKWALVWSYR